MLAFFIQRLLQAVLVMVAVGFIAFSLFNFVGDPVSLMLPPEATSADRDEVRKSLGLDQPFYLQFAKFVGNALQGNFGISLRLGRPVSQLLIERLPATLELSVIAASLALLVGIPMGVYTALKRDSWMSKFILTISLIGVSLPSFLIGIFLILIFAVWLGWLPSFGRGDTVRLGLWTTGFLTVSGLKALILPSITLGLFQMTLGDAGGSAYRLHQVRARARADEQRGTFWPCPQEHVSTRTHHCRSAAGRHYCLRHHYRDRVPVAGHGSVVHTSGTVRRYSRHGGLSVPYRPHFCVDQFHCRHVVLRR